MIFECKIKENPQKWGKMGIVQRAAGWREERDGCGLWARRRGVRGFGCAWGGVMGQWGGGRDEQNVEGAVPYTLAGSFYVTKTRLSQL